MDAAVVLDTLSSCRFRFREMILMLHHHLPTSHALAKAVIPVFLAAAPYPMSI